MECLMQKSLLDMQTWMQLYDSANEDFFGMPMPFYADANANVCTYNASVLHEDANANVCACHVWVCPCMGM